MNFSRVGKPGPIACSYKAKNGSTVLNSCKKAKEEEYFMMCKNDINFNFIIHM